jgi:TetR/AcrR family transcriptional regulator, transcriptional repressor for nem operon
MKTMSVTPAPTTSTQILDIAQRLMQTRGYARFSYADIASELGTTKAALHYHFGTKAELGVAVLERYIQEFEAALAATGGLAPASARLEAYIGLYDDVLRGQRMCLCGMLAAEVDTMPVPMRTRVLCFLDDNVTWLEAVLAAGVDDASLQVAGDRRAVATSILSSLQGGMLIARAHGTDRASFDRVAAQIRAELMRTGRRSPAT